MVSGINNLVKEIDNNNIFLFVQSKDGSYSKVTSGVNDTIVDRLHTALGNDVDVNDVDIVYLTFDNECNTESFSDGDIIITTSNLGYAYAIDVVPYHKYGYPLAVHKRIRDMNDDEKNLVEKAFLDNSRNE